MNQSSQNRNTCPIGIVLAPHGLKGEVKVRPQIHDIDTLNGVKVVTAASPNGTIQNLELTGVRGQGKRVILSFEGIVNRSDAEALHGAELSISREDLPPLASGEYYLGDLLGYEVVTNDNAILGKVREVWDLPAHEVLQVMHDDQEVLIPLIDEVVTAIDHDQHRIRISPLEGLLD